MRILPEKIGALIGTGGKVIKKITEITGAQIDINEDNSGRLSIFAPTKQALKNAIAEVERATSDIEPNKVYRGIIRSIKEFGIFVECFPGKEGLVHVSEITDGHVNHPEDVCKIGEEILVKCIGIDPKGRVRLSAKAARHGGGAHS
jgi:polyribonucleotide nucleotidyltransferase